MRLCKRWLVALMALVMLTSTVASGEALPQADAEAQGAVEALSVAPVNNGQPEAPEAMAEAASEAIEDVAVEMNGLLLDDSVPEANAGTDYIPQVLETYVDASDKRIALSMSAGDTLKVYMSSAVVEEWIIPSKYAGSITAIVRDDGYGESYTEFHASEPAEKVKLTCVATVVDRKGRENRKKIKATLTVADPCAPTEIRFVGMPFSVTVGQSVDLSDKLDLYPTGTASIDSVTFKVSGSGKLTGGSVLTAMKAGSVSITATSRSNKKVKATYKLTVTANKQDRMNPSPDSDDLNGLSGWTLWPVSAEIKNDSVVCKFYVLNGSDEKTARIENMTLTMATGSWSHDVASVVVSSQKLKASKRKAKSITLKLRITENGFSIPENYADGTLYFKINADARLKTKSGGSLSFVYTPRFPASESEPEPPDEGDFRIEGGVIIGYTGPGGSIAIPAQDRDGNPVTAIGEGAFQDNTSITHVSAQSQSLAEIGASAFEGCSSLKSVVLPASLRAIGKSAFRACPVLSSMNANSGNDAIVIPAGVETIGDYAFFDDPAIRQVVVPNTVTALGMGGFGNCVTMELVRLPASLSTIGYGVFDNCADNLTITLPEGSYAEDYCSRNDLNYIYDTDKPFFNFSIEPQRIPVRTTATVAITVECASPNAQISLFDSQNNNLGSLHDDGRNGDAAANDGIYTFTMGISSDMPAVEHYCVGNNAYLTDTIDLTFYIDAASQPALVSEAAERIESSIEGIEAQYSDAHGFVTDVDAALEGVEGYVQEMAANKEVVSYQRTGDSLIFKTAYGITYVYQPDNGEYELGGNTARMYEYVFRPCMEGRSGSGLAAMERPLNAANLMERTFGNYTYQSTWDDASVTLDRVAGIGENSVVLWAGHGTYYNGIGPVLVTGESFNSSRYANDQEYRDMFINDVLIVSSSNKILVTPAFIDQKCGSMNNTFIYLAACKSGYDNKLANAFLRKGAQAVVASTNTIYTVYTYLMQQTTFEYMCAINPSTRNYYTLDEALTAAFADHGSDDRVWYYNTYGSYPSDHSAAKPKIFGGAAAKNVRLGVIQGNLVGEVKDASDESALPGVTVSLYLGNTLVRQTTTNVGGEYAFNDLDSGDYTLRFASDGFIPSTYNATVVTGEYTYLEPVLLVRGQAGQTGGTYGIVTHTVSGNLLSGVTLKVYSGWNTFTGEVVARTTTDSNGHYSFALPVGYYTVVASLSGFSDSFLNVTIQADRDTDCGDLAMAPMGTGDLFTIVLRWNIDPRDLDSHVVGRLSDNSQFHVYYRAKNAYDGETLICNLDRDDVDSEGPETTRLIPVTTTAPYYFFVHRYAGSGSISTSGATVRVYKSNRMIAMFNAPTDQGTGDYWNVFYIQNGEIHIVNSITNSAMIGAYSNASEGITSNGEVLPEK